MLLFKQRINSDISNSNDKPIQIISKEETIKEQADDSIPKVSSEKQLDFVTIPTSNSNIINKRYNNDSPFKDLFQIRTPKVLKTEIIRPKIISNLNDIKTNKNQYYSKVIIQNVPSTNTMIDLLENYLTENNYKIYYETSFESDKIIFVFHEEKIAFEFTKLLYNEKNKNPLYKDIIIRLSLSPNQIYIKNNMENKKRGLSHESILKLFNGNSYVRPVKPPKKIYGNFNFGIKSPFFSIHDKINKINKNRSEKSFDGKHKLKYLNSVPNSGDINGYVGYDGKPLKNYEKLRISVLDTHYNPSNFEYREDNKDRWVSPSNFKFY
jgi:hypothetical protein